MSKSVAVMGQGKKEHETRARVGRERKKSIIRGSREDPTNGSRVAAAMGNGTWVDEHRLSPAIGIGKRARA